MAKHSYYKAASPLAAALERLSKLSGAGTAPDRMTRATEKLLADWQADPDLAPDALAERLESLRENLAAGVADAEEQAGDVDTGDKAATRQAAATLAGLRAALAAVTR